MPSGIRVSAILRCRRRRLKIIGMVSARVTGPRSAMDLRPKVRVTDSISGCGVGCIAGCSSLCRGCQFEGVSVFARCAFGQRHVERIGSLRP